PALVALIALGAQASLKFIAQALRKAKTPDFSHPRALLSIGAVALGLILFTFVQFQRWALSAEADLAYRGRLGHLAAYLDRMRDNLTTSICTLNLDGDSKSQLSDPVLMDLMLHRKDDHLRYSNCLEGLVITRGGETQRFAYADPDGPKA